MTLEQLLATPARVEAGYLLALLEALWERLPEDLGDVPWRSPTGLGPEELEREVDRLQARAWTVLALSRPGPELDL